MNELSSPTPQSGWTTVVNGNFAALFEGVGLYAENDLTTTGLVWGYFGGPLSDSVDVVDGVTTSLASADTVYAVMHRTTGVLTHATTTTNWDNTTTYGRVRLFVTGASTITSSIDWRFLSGGIFDRSGTATVDADDVTYTPAVNADWDGSTDPGSTKDALDQLAERVTDIEAGGGGSVSTDAIWDAAGDLAVGTGANTAAKLTMGSALQVLRVNAAGTALEYAAPAAGGSFVGIESTASFTRPSDTTTYGAGDVICNSTSAPTIMTFTGVGAANGGAFILQNAKVIDSAAQSLKPDIDLFLFKSSVTIDNDNSGFTPTDVEMEDLICVVSFYGAAFVVGSGNGQIKGQIEPAVYKCGAGTTSIYGVAVARNAYIPISDEEFDFVLGVLQL
jgi:hypothetical protein